MRLPLVILVVVAGFTSAPALSAPDDKATSKPKPVLVKVNLKSGKWFVGELMKEGPGETTILDLKSGKERVFRKWEAVDLDRDISDATAIRYSDLQSVLAWKISKLAAGRAPVEGKIAKVTTSVVYLNVGADHGVASDQTMDVFRDEGAVTDPDTGKVLARERSRIASVQIVEVKPSYSKARMVGDLEIKLAVGDEVEAAARPIRVAVFPLVDTEGNETTGGTALAEDLTTALVDKKVPVVERSLFDKAMKELVIQRTGLFDQKTAQRVGKQLGASAVLTGKVVARGRSATAYVRLIDVESGRVLLASSKSVAVSAATADAKPGAAGAGTGSTKGMYRLGGRARLPVYFERSDKVLAERDGLRMNGRYYVRTKQRDFLKRDFRFEVVYQYKGDKGADGIAWVGIGEADRDTAYNEPGKSVALRMHPPKLAGGGVSISQGRVGGTTIGRIPNAGTHKAIIEKRGEVVTLMIDVDNDGPSDDDIEKTIPDISAFAPHFHGKNTHLFFGGGALFTHARLTSLK